MTILDRLLGRGSGNLFEQQEQTRRIIRLLREGLTPEEVEGDLVRQGVTPRQARRLVRLTLKARREGVHLFDAPSSPGSDEE